ncbi:hypothetical protein D9758_009516 [Tetrapyrgos nigripes]|uniref:Cytochrome P450 n=1 Tax=Tetrapyrgos nigripes TaxID=182062 RepID=A0A8H5G173_9AGAR|nr:hypothetical protein D9758_009516 [Tetrapyrgos nigripes]
MVVHLDSNLFTVGVICLVFLIGKFVRAYHENSKLSKIPTVGPDGILTSYITLFKWISQGTDLIEEGYRQNRGRIFKVPSIDGWYVVAAGAKLVEDIRKASEDELSSREGTCEVVHGYYTMYPDTVLDPYHAEVIRTKLTRDVGIHFDDLHEEIEDIVSKEIPLTEDWTEIHAWPKIMSIVAHTSNRFFVGLPLSRNSDFRKVNIDFAESLFRNAIILLLFPKFLHPIVGRIFTGRRVAMRQIKKYLKPIIEERLRMKEQFGEDWADKPNDLIQWLMDAEELAPLSKRTSVEDLCARMLTVNLASINTTSLILSTLLQLAAHTEFADPLRNEVESVVKRAGWTKDALDQMRMLDSFVKESTRLQPSGPMLPFRKAMKDFTFSDGTTVPAGNLVTTAAWSILRDEELYPNGNEFKPFRFSELREKEEESMKHQLVTINPEWMVFGQGKHACPGRFFASTEIKAILAHVVLHYDVKLPNDSKETPAILKKQLHTGPSLEATVMFRKRSTLDLSYISVRAQRTDVTNPNCRIFSITLFKWISQGTDLIEEGYRQNRGRIFKVPSIDGWFVVAAGTKLVEDIRKASEDELSSREGTCEVIRGYYTMYADTVLDPYHAEVIRTKLTGDVGIHFDDLHEEIEDIVSKEIPLTEDWTEIRAWPKIMSIVAHTSNRFFVGLPLSRNSDFRQVNIDFTASVFRNAIILLLFLKFLLPIVGRIFTGRRVAMRRIKKFLRPIIEERLRMKEQFGEDWADKPNDLIQWLMDAEEFAPLSKRTSVEDLCARVLVSNFGSINSTSLILSTLLQLAAHTEFADPLRNEVESVVKREGWTKDALDQMRMLDSFVKESARLQPSVLPFRKAMKDFTFSDGTTVPAGNLVTTAAWSILRDEELYPNRNEFKPFRFSELREKEEESMKHQLVTVNSEWMVFGQGKHACPGRFFASTEIKAILAHVVLHYDVKLPNDSKETPATFKKQIHTGPSLEATVLCRQRRSG